MPQIIVSTEDLDDGKVTLRERVTLADLESGHFAKYLLERLSWALGDADQIERRPAARSLDRAEADELDEVDESLRAWAQVSASVVTTAS